MRKQVDGQLDLFADPPHREQPRPGYAPPPPIDGYPSIEEEIDRLRALDPPTQLPLPTAPLAPDMSLPETPEIDDDIPF